MADDEYRALMSKMADIASAVNQFKSETLQAEVFNLLVESYLGHKANAVDRGVDESAPKSRSEQPRERAEPPAARERPQKTKRKPITAGRDGFTAVKDLDLRPAGKQSLADFIALKLPKTNEDRFACAVYYLQTVMELPKVTADHVGTVFRLTPSWKEPSSLAAGLRMTSTRKGTIDTADQADLRITPHGRNFVEHDLPYPKRNEE